MASETIAYSQKDLRDIKKAFKLIDEEASNQVAIQSVALANFAAEEIKAAARTRTKSGKVSQRVADGVSVSKSTKTQAAKLGTFSYGFARQKFSGGANTQTLWGGVEFGSNKFKQFPAYSGRSGRGSRGWFIYPTLRRIQPELINKWEAAYNRILDKWA